MINICCFKWGTKYPAVYVERLLKMVGKNLSIPFKFHCFTDNEDGLTSTKLWKGSLLENNRIEVHPLIDPDFKGAWHQATIFKPDIGISGTILYLDLDIVIVDSIDDLVQWWEKEFVEHRGEVLIMKWEKGFLINKDWNLHGIYNGSAFMFEAGAWPDAWAALQDIKDSVKDTELGAQRFITDFFRGKATFWPEGWLVSYKKHAIGGYPDDAKIVVFHGEPNPHQAIWGWQGWPPEPWIVEHWGGPI